MSVDRPHVTVCAGIPAINAWLHHRIRFPVGDPAALVTVHAGKSHGNSSAANTGIRRILILRDIEMDRARKSARTDVVACPADYTPPGGLSGDRETATAQAVAQCVIRSGASAVSVDRSTPAIYWHELAAAGLNVTCDPLDGVAARRVKDAQEIGWLRQCQRDTEAAVRMACQTIAAATVRDDGVLIRDGKPLTSGRVREAVDVFLLRRGYQNPEAIIAGGIDASDCHEHGHAELHTCEAVIVDIFPRNRKTLYNGDCTRTVVHGAPPKELIRMHAAVVAAKAAAIALVRPGVTGEAIHAETSRVIREAGFAMGMPSSDETWARARMTHGTGHGVGLEVHEPPLLALNGPALLEGDVVTIEPGLYQPGLGGVRVEDMVVVTANGCDNLGELPEGLDWRV
ncbi:MAG: M24 family metallopeptidase [Phycisphaerales bacterium]|nr:M24 family metallopeptidase [Phycisphaerales bacterium]